jgi:hypothetical protein
MEKEKTRTHRGLRGEIPSKACGIELKGNDKWKTLIKTQA